MRSCVPSRTTVCRYLLPRNVLLDYRPCVLRCLALYQLPLHARNLACTNIHRQLYSTRAFRVFQCLRGKARTKTSIEILAEK